MPAPPSLLLRKLQIVDAGTGSVVLPDSSAASGVEVWPDVEGRPRAYTYVAGGRCWVHYPEAATYSFRSRDECVTAVPIDGTERWVVEDTFVRFVLPLTVQATGREVLHASAVRGPRGLIAICGNSGAGKSTIAYGLAERGYHSWADDAVCFEARGNQVRAVPLPFVRRLRSDAVEYFGADAERLAKLAKWRSRPAQLEGKRTAERFCALFVVERRRRPGRGRTVEIRRIPPIEVFTAILPHCQPFTLADASRKRRMVAQYLRLSSTAPVFELRFQNDLSRLPLVLDAVERTVASLSRRHGLRLESRTNGGAKFADGNRNTRS